MALRLYVCFRLEGPTEALTAEWLNRSACHKDKPEWEVARKSGDQLEGYRIILSRNGKKWNWSRCLRSRSSSTYWLFARGGRVRKRRQTRKAICEALVLDRTKHKEDRILRGIIIIVITRITISLIFLGYLYLHYAKNFIRIISFNVNKVSFIITLSRMEKLKLKENK